MTQCSTWIVVAVEPELLIHYEKHLACALWLWSWGFGNGTHVPGVSVFFTAISDAQPTSFHCASAWNDIDSHWNRGEMFSVDEFWLI